MCNLVINILHLCQTSKIACMFIRVYVLDLTNSWPWLGNKINYSVGLHAYTANSKNIATVYRSNPSDKSWNVLSTYCLFFTIKRSNLFTEFLLHFELKLHIRNTNWFEVNVLSIRQVSIYAHMIFTRTLLCFVVLMLSGQSWVICFIEVFQILSGNIRQHTISYGLFSKPNQSKKSLYCLFSKPNQSKKIIFKVSTYNYK